MNCPFYGECILKGEYKAKGRDKKYIGFTETSFKTRWQQHKHSMLKKLQTTALAKFTTSDNIFFRLRNVKVLDAKAEISIYNTKTTCFRFLYCSFNVFSISSEQ